LAPLADEILVWDSYSSDATPSIAAQYGARFVQAAWQGFAATKNVANAAATHDWILSLDADEVLSEALQQSLLRLKAEGFGGDVAYSFRRLPNFCGHWLYHGAWNPDWKTRLFHRARAEWLGPYVHEQLALKPGTTVQPLTGLCYHYTATSLEAHWAKLNRYTSLKAQEATAQGRSPQGLAMLLKPWAKFWEHYLLRGGFRDGVPGLLVAALGSYSKFLTLAKTWQQQHQNGAEVDPPAP
jgi:hypothetical protein